MMHAICGWCKRAALRINYGWYCQTEGCGAYAQQINPIIPRIRL